MASKSVSRNSEGNFVKTYWAWNGFDLPKESKENDSLGSHRVMNEAQANEELTNLYIAHPKILDADFDKRSVEVENLDNLDHIKDKISDFNFREIEETGKSLGRLLGDFHRNRLSHGDAHLANFLYDDGDIIPFDFEFYSSNSPLSEMKDDIRLLESDARTLCPETYETLIEGFHEGYRTELTSLDEYSKKVNSSQYRDDLKEFVNDIVQEKNQVNPRYGFTRIMEEHGSESRIECALNYITNSTEN